MTSTRKLARDALLLVAFCATVAAVVAVRPPVAQAADCGGRSLSQPFRSLGDSRSYFLIPGGSFESGAPNWLLNGASVVSGNESLYLRSTSDRSSLRISSAATSPRFCITRSDPHVRLVARSVQIAGSNGNYSSLNVTAVIRNSSGSVMSYYLGSMNAPKNSGWFVTPPLSWGSAFADWLFAADGTAT